jgi:HK97 family phage major capsid protein
MPKNNITEQGQRALTGVIDVSKINVEARTVIFPFSSETRVKTAWGDYEILSHDDGAVDLSRLNDGGAVLIEHGGRQIGIVSRAWIEDGRGWCEIRLSRNAEGESMLTDIADGIVRNVSVGYQRDLQSIEYIDDTDTFRTGKWMPYEVSFVAIPADTTVGIGRSLSHSEAGNATGDTNNNTSEKQQTSEGKRTMTPEEKAAAEAAIRAQVIKEYETKQKAEDARRSEITAIAEMTGMTEDGKRAIAEDMPVDAFRKMALETLAAKRTAQVSNIGMSQKEIKQFSFRRAILGQLVDGGVDASFEKECSRAYAAQIGRDARGLFVPPDVIMDGAIRAFNKTTGAGANLIETQLLAGSFIDILRNKSVTAQAGATMLPGLVGNVAIPRQTAGMTAYWFNSETHGITAASNITIDQVTMSPKTVGAYGDVSRSLLKQSTPAAEQLTRNDIALRCALAIDLAAMKGTAADGQPRGVKLTSGINSANWAAANTPTWAELVAMETAVDTANALEGDFVYVMGSGIRGACKTTVKAAGQMGFLMDPDGRINGYRVIGSNQMAAGEVLFGNMTQLFIGMWGGLDLQVNPYIEALEKAGAIRVTALQDVDIAVRQPKAFTWYDNAAVS